MREVFSMWKNTRMIILVALSAAIYAAFLIVFKAGIPIVPGITEVRPANVFPPVFGLLFGPAGAWGAAIGNTIGDLFGALLILLGIVLTTARSPAAGLSTRDLRRGVALATLAVAMNALGVTIAKPVLDRSPVLWSRSRCAARISS